MSNGKRPAIDEDVDDLDDVLDQFSSDPVPAASTARAAPAPATSSGPSASGAPTQAPPSGDAEDDDFARELAEGMEALMKELGGSVPGASTSQPGASGDDAERDRALLKAWEAMLAEDMDGAAAGTTTDASKTLASGSAKGPDAGVEDAFQKTIREAMDRMKENEDVLKASDQSAGGTDSSLTALLSSLGDLEGLGGEGSESGEELQGMLESMMTQLMSKEVIYEPLKELHEKFPAYLSNNASTLSADDQARYTAQQNCVTKIIAVFENPHYSDEDTKMASDVVTLMNEMQSHGSPPSELMGPLPTGFDVGADGLPKIPENCTIM